MRRSKKILAGVVVIIVIAVALSAWTLSSPSVLPVHSQADLENGLFASSYTSVSYNITDGSGEYFFKFGVDYDQTILNHSATEISVYCALAGERITSYITKGVALSLQSSSLVVDGRPFSGSTITSKLESGLQVYSFGIRNFAGPEGNHTFSVLLFVSTVDVNYIGNLPGSFQAVSLNGSFGFR